MQPEVRVGMCLRKFHDFIEPRARHHDAGGAHPALFECLERSEIRGVRHPEIVRMQNQQLAVGGIAHLFQQIRTANLGAEIRSGRQQNSTNQQKSLYHSGLSLCFAIASRFNGTKLHFNSNFCSPECNGYSLPFQTSTPVSLPGSSMVASTLSPLRL